MYLNYAPTKNEKNVLYRENEPKKKIYVHSNVLPIKRGITTYTRLSMQLKKMLQNKMVIGMIRLCSAMG